MSDTMIKVEGLGKKYIISHQGSASYTAMRDVIANKTKKLLSRKTDTPTREEFWALKDISFEIKKGDAIGIIGRNGAGKSTLLKVLSRITEPSHGRIEINGRVASLLEVGTGFHPELTGRENIFLNGAILGMSRFEIRNKFDEIVDFSGVEKFLDTPVKRYSSGMYVRLAFAVAAHLEPEVLIVDEVLAVGDAEFQKKCLGRMKDVSEKDGITVLFVSHNIGAIKQLCNKGMFLKNGRLENAGDINDVISNYTDVFQDQYEYSFTEKDKKPLFINTISVKNNEGIGKNSFIIQEKIVFDINIKINELKAGSVMGFFITDNLNSRVFTDEVAIENLVTDASANNFTLQISIPKNFFIKGIYTANFALYIPNVNMFHFVGDLVRFSIEDLPPNIAKYQNTELGNVNSPCEWKVIN